MPTNTERQIKKDADSTTSQLRPTPIYYLDGTADYFAKLAEGASRTARKYRRASRWAKCAKFVAKIAMRSANAASESGKELLDTTHDDSNNVAHASPVTDSTQVQPIPVIGPIPSQYWEDYFANVQTEIDAEIAEREAAAAGEEI